MPDARLFLWPASVWPTTLSCIWCIWLGASQIHLLGDNILRVLALSFANFGVYCFANDFPLSQDPSNEVG